MLDETSFAEYRKSARQALIAISTLLLCVLVLMTPFAFAAFPNEDYDDQKLSDQYWDAEEAGDKHRQEELYDEIHLKGGHIDEGCGGCSWPNTMNNYRLGLHRLTSFFVD